MGGRSSSSSMLWSMTCSLAKLQNEKIKILHWRGSSERCSWAVGVEPSTFKVPGATQRHSHAAGTLQVQLQPQTSKSCETRDRDRDRAAAETTRLHLYRVTIDPVALLSTLCCAPARGSRHVHVSLELSAAPQPAPYGRRPARPKVSNRPAGQGPRRSYGDQRRLRLHIHENTSRHQIGRYARSRPRRSVRREYARQAPC
jgi:hypothetical protein